VPKLAPLERWARSKDGSIAAATAKLDAMPLSETGKGVAVPFPHADKEAIKSHFSNEQIAQAIARAPTKRVALKGLRSLQHSVRPERVAEYIAHPDVVDEGARHHEHGGPIDVPIIMQFRGQRFAWDGNHRSVAAYLTGEKTIDARLVDLDSLETE
jgi:hypothetical protein